MLLKYYRSSKRNRFVAKALAFITFAVFFIQYLIDQPTYGQPLCDASGKCNEKPEIASPRTIYSTRSKEENDKWWKAHAALNQSAKEYDERRREQQQKQIGENNLLPPLILFGDSITESWLGTDMGVQKDRAEGVPEVLDEFFKSNYDPLVLAIGGDQTQHLLYRLQNGQLLPTYAEDENSIYVILIGTNNLGRGELPGPTSRGVTRVAEYILENTKGKLLLINLLPRGDIKRLEPICPPRCNSQGKPFKSFMPAIKKVNDKVQIEANLLLNGDYNKRMSILDCGSSFLDESSLISNDEENKITKSEVKEDLMPDQLHPNAEGHRILAKCILDGINALDEK